MKHVEIINTLSTLSDTLKNAADIIKKTEKTNFYLVIVKDVGAPEILEFDNIHLCLEKLQQLQKEQAEKPDIPIYVCIFEGFRWNLTKHPSKGIACGDQFIPISTEDQVENTNVFSLTDLIRN